MQKLATIFIYHRVLNLENDPQLLAVSPENFEAQICYLKNNYSFLFVKDLIKLIIENKEIPKNTVSITFDDGYYDNYKFLLPILEKHKIPATIFVSTGYINGLNFDRKKEFWWDELERIFIENYERLLNKKISFSIKNKKIMMIFKTKNEVKEFYYKIHKKLKYLPYIERDKIIQYLFDIINIDRSNIRDNYRALNKNELIELSKSQFIEIGAHTINHPVLSMEDFETQKNEITKSKNELEKAIEKEIISFSYPFGSYRDYNETTIKILKETGFQYAIANRFGTINDKNLKEKNFLFNIPRILIRNWDIETFKKEINKIDSFKIKLKEYAKKIYFNFFE